MNSTGTWDLGDVSMDGFLADRRDDIERLLAGVRSVCRFGDETMAIVDELGRFREHTVDAAFLLLWSGGVTGVPQPLERLEEPSFVRRMCRTAADLQLVNLLQALVTAAVAAGTEPDRGAPEVARVLRIASDLADPAGKSAPALVFRMWRVAHLPGILRPGSGTPQQGKTGFRAYARALEELLATP
ncbi:hypothetical protein [Streptomyces sp. NPDC051636]|uniref:hypothetical protein n=1 Tax=Streptomyces sp. NPDC051636 TaxID=3365663 RepID=UPI003792EEA0